MSNANPGNAGTYVVEALPASPSEGYQPGSLVNVRAATAQLWCALQNAAGAIAFGQLYPAPTPPQDWLPRTQVLTVTPAGSGVLTYRWELSTADGIPTPKTVVLAMFSSVGGLSAVVPSAGSLLGIYDLDADTQLVLLQCNAAGVIEFNATGTAGNAVDAAFVNMPYLQNTNTNAFPP